VKKCKDVSQICADLGQQFVLLYSHHSFVFALRYSVNSSSLHRHDELFIVLYVYIVPLFSFSVFLLKVSLSLVAINSLMSFIFTSFFCFRTSLCCK
jgi:hypothetical protein